MFEKILKFIKDILFPIYCAQCGAEGEWWCKNCLREEEIKPFTFSAVPPLLGVTAFFEYKEGAPVAKLIRQYKYNYAGDIERVWENIFTVGARHALPSPDRGAVIIPVPLYKRRERERGFNQAERLAKILSNVTGLPLSLNRLRRIKKTAQQAKLSRPERQTNVEGAFVWEGNEPAPASVILVDDVYTTGATMAECAKVLIEHGAKQIYGIVIAKD